MEPSEHTPEEVRKVAEFGFDRDRFRAELREVEPYTGWVTLDADTRHFAPFGNEPDSQALAQLEAGDRNAGGPNLMLWCDEQGGPARSPR